MHSPRGDLAIPLSRGGATAAYQVGVLRGLARHLPRAQPVILTGESAGAINVAYLAAYPGALPEAIELDQCPINPAAQKLRRRRPRPPARSEAART